MAFKVKPIYGSAAAGKKPIKWVVVDSDGIVVDTHLYEADAKREAAKRNAADKGGRHFTRI